MYCIEAIASDGKTFLFIDSITIDSLLLLYDNHILIDTPTFNPILQPPSFLSGTIIAANTAEQPGSVHICELDRHTTIEPNGTFLFVRVPAGTFNLHISSSSPAPETEHRITVQTSTGNTTILDTLYRISISETETTTESIHGQYYYTGDTITVPVAPQKTGFSFTGWTTSEEENARHVAPGETVIVSSSTHTFFPVWERLHYQINHIVSGKGIITVPDTAAYGVPIAITAVPDAGEHFIKWAVIEGNAVIGDTSSPPTEITILGDSVIIQAYFSPLTFSRVFEGGPLIGMILGKTICCSNDGGYVFETEARYQVGHFSIVKTDRFGNRTWTTRITTEYPAVYCAIIPSTDSGYIILRAVEALSTLIMLYKIDSSGSLQWEKTFAEELNGYWCLPPSQLLPTVDGGCALVSQRFNIDGGSRNGEATTVITFSAAGEKRSTKFLFGTEQRFAQLDADGSIVFHHIEREIPSVTYRQFSIDTDGNETSSRHVYLPDYIDTVRFVNSTTDGGWRYYGITKGDADEISDNFRYFTIRTNAKGDIVGTLIEEQDSRFENVVITSDYGFIAGGTGGCTRIAADGSILWTKKYRSVNNNGISRIHIIKQTQDEGLILAGSSSYNDNTGLFLAKTDKNGDMFQSDLK